MSVSGLRITAVLVILLAVLGATLAIFIDWAPAGAHAIYWTVMADVAVLEAAGGGYALAVTLRASGRKTLNWLPFPIHTSIVYVAAVFFLATVVIDLIGLRASVSAHLFVWIIIVKWVLLAVTVAALALVGTEGKEQQARIAASLPKRIDLNKSVDKISGDLRGMSVAEADKPLLNEVSDKVDILRNKARSLTNARSSETDSSTEIQGLVADLAGGVSKSKASPADVKPGLTQSRNAAVELIRLLG